MFLRLRRRRFVCIENGKRITRDEEVLVNSDDISMIIPISNGMHAQYGHKSRIFFDSYIIVANGEDTDTESDYIDVAETLDELSELLGANGRAV